MSQSGFLEAEFPEQFELATWADHPAVDWAASCGGRGKAQRAQARRERMTLWPFGLT